MLYYPPFSNTVKPTTLRVVYILNYGILVYTVQDLRCLCRKG